MRKEQFGFNELCKISYSPFLTNNVAQVNHFTFSASPTWELALPLNITYEALDQRLREHFHIRGSSDDEGNGEKLQQYRNHRSTLTGFLASVGKTNESRVGTELGSAFDSALARYLEMLSVGSRSKSDRRAHLKLIQRLYETPGPDKAEKSAEFKDVLRCAIASTGLPAKTLARSIGASTSAVQRWLAGATPNRRGIPTLRRLEIELGLERDSLVRMVHEEPNSAKDTPHCEKVSGGSRPIAHRVRMAEREQEPGLTLRQYELTDEFKSEWKALVDYKTTSFPLLERQSRGVWRLIPLDSIAPLPEFTNHNGMACPTAARCFVSVLDFLGTVLQLRIERGGSIPLSPDNMAAQTLAWLAHPLALKTYIDRLTSKSNGVQHSGHRVFCAFVGGLLRSGTGYLWQQPRFADRLPPELRPANETEWRSMCENSHKMLKVIQGKSKSLSRVPAEPIAFLLELDNPLKPILDAIQRIDQAAARAPTGGHRQAQLKRDALLLSLILSNPLRLRTMMSMTWNSHGTGSLRGSPSSGWRIALTPAQLKNGASSINRHYNVQVAQWVKPRLDEYIEEYRDTLLRGQDSKYLFVSGRGTGIWKSLGKRVFELTRQYIDDSPGFGPHGFRHLIATDWLMRHPNDYLTVAELLNDRLGTVIANYAHLKRDTSFSRYEQHIGTML